MSSLYSKLRPAKVRSALTRRRFEYAMTRIPVTGWGEPADVGTEYGGWMLPVAAMRPGWCCYCVGVGADVSFDLELIRRFDAAAVRAFEPVHAYVDQALETAAGEPRFSADAVAIAPFDGPVRMQASHHPGSASVSLAGIYETTDYTEMPGRSIPSLMSEYGDDRIDLLKLDVEGGEYELVPQLDLVGLGVKVFAIQLHRNGGVRGARELIAWLGDKGYEPIAQRYIIKITFVNRALLAG